MINKNNIFLNIQKKENEKVKEFLCKNNINIKDDTYGRTSLMNASFYNSIEILEWLLSQNADVNAQDKKGYTALHFSVQEANLTVTEQLLKNGANVNIQDIHGNTPSSVAVTNWKGGKNFEALQKLIKNNADLSIKNNAGISAKDIIPEKILEKLYA